MKCDKGIIKLVDVWKIKMKPNNVKIPEMGVKVQDTEDDSGEITDRSYLEVKMELEHKIVLNGWEYHDIKEGGRLLALTARVKLIY